MNEPVNPSMKITSPSKWGYKISLLLIILTVTFLTSCGGGQATEAPTAKTQPTKTKTLTPTSTATAAPTSTPTLTPTPKLPVSPGTAMPESSIAISADNLDEVVELARWGSGVITDAIYSPDGTVIALGSSVGISLFQVETVEEILYIETDSGINELSFSPNGDMITAGLKDDTARIWDVEDGELLYTLEGHTDEVVSVAFSPDESLLATGSLDGSVKLWKTSDGTLQNTIEGSHYKELSGVIFSPDGQALFSGSGDSTVYMAQVSDGKVLNVFSGYSDGGIAISANGEILAGYGLDNTSRGKITLWQVETGEMLDTIQEDYVTSLAVSPDGQYIAAGLDDYTVKVWNTSTVALKNTLEDLQPEGYYYWGLFYVAFSPDGQTIVLAGHDVVGIWDVITGEILRSKVTNSQKIYSVSISTNEKMLASVEGLNVNLFNLSNGEIIPIQDEIQSTGNVVFSPNGSSIAVGFIDGIAQMWPIAEDAVRKSFETNQKNYVTRVAFSPDGQTIAIGDENGTIELRNVSDGGLIRDFKPFTAWYVDDLAFSPDGKLLASVVPGDRLTLYDVSNSVSPQIFRNGLSMAFSSDGSILAGGLSDKSIKVWDVSTGNELLNLKDQPEDIWSLAISPDGNILVSGDDIGAIKVWNLSDGTQITTWRAHSDRVVDLIFTSDGAKLISASHDGTIRFWGIKP